MASGYDCIPVQICSHSQEMPLDNAPLHVPLHLANPKGPYNHN